MEVAIVYLMLRMEHISEGMSFE